MERFPRNEFIEEAKKLGKSKEYLDATLSYIDKLESNQLPVIFSLKHLSHLTKVKYSELQSILVNNGKFYKGFKLNKKRGGYRYIKAPVPPLKGLQKWINSNIFSQVKPHSLCFSYTKNKSIKDNASVHAGEEAILKVDIYRFFESIHQYRVADIFESLGYSRNLAIDLSKITTIVPDSYYIKEVDRDVSKPQGFELSSCGVLPQGSPTSPVISNIVALNLDKRLKGLARACGINYSRYSDDITFSGDKKKLPKVKIIEQIIKDEGFYINKKKTQLRIKGQRQIVTGLSVSHEVKIPKHFKREIRKHIYYCQKFGPRNHLDKINSDKRNFKDWLYGCICYIKSIEEDTGSQMLEEFDRINWLFFYD